MASFQKVMVTGIRDYDFNIYFGFPRGSDGKESACSAGDLVFDLLVRKIPWRIDGYPLQYFCLGRPTDRGTWLAAVHGFSKNQAELSN